VSGVLTYLGVVSFGIDMYVAAAFQIGNSILVLRSCFLHNWAIERSKHDSNNGISCFVSTWQRKTRCWWLLLSMLNRGTIECFCWEKRGWKEWNPTQSPPKLYSEQSKATLNGDDGCTTSTTTVQRVVKPDTNTFQKQFPQDTCHIVALEKLWNF
jgi:hypothetical protein